MKEIKDRNEYCKRKSPSIGRYDTTIVRIGCFGGIVVNHMVVVAVSILGTQTSKEVI